MTNPDPSLSVVVPTGTRSWGGHRKVQEGFGAGSRKYSYFRKPLDFGLEPNPKHVENEPLTGSQHQPNTPFTYIGGPTSKVVAEPVYILHFHCADELEMTKALAPTSTGPK
jgi:hypothetical protein